MSQSAYRWWLEALAPFAEAGYRTGWISDFDVELTDGIHRISIPRGGWTAAASIEAAAQPDDRPELSAEDFAAVASLMSIEDVTQGMIGFLA